MYNHQSVWLHSNFNEFGSTCTALQHSKICQARLYTPKTNLTSSLELYVCASEPCWMVDVARLYGITKATGPTYSATVYVDCVPEREKELALAVFEHSAQ